MMNKLTLTTALLGAALMLQPATSLANQGIDSSPNLDLPISAGGQLIMTLCGGGATCGGAYGRILFGPDPTNPTAWIDTNDGTSSFGGTPSGTIAAFNLGACPTGWVSVPGLAGRTVIGTGQGVGLTDRTAGETGGEEKHTMTVAELVPHEHTSTYWVSQVRAGDTGNYWNVLQGASNWDSGGAGGPFTTWTPESSSTGQGQPFNVMMPWVALTYCQKS